MCSESCRISLNGVSFILLQSKPTGKKKNTYFLMNVQKKGTFAFNIFYDALVRVSNSSVSVFVLSGCGLDRTISFTRLSVRDYHGSFLSMHDRPTLYFMYSIEVM